jgi:hypothetical protein
MVTKMKIDGVVAKAISAYLGVPALDALECYPDPEVAGTYAFRATLRATTYDFLTIGVPLNRVTDEDLEECDWPTWPPESDFDHTVWVLR